MSLDQSTVMDASVTKSLLAAANAAPSPDNNQPWQFRVRDDRIEIYLDDQHRLRSDVEAMFDLHAIGAAVENLLLAGSQHDLTGTARYSGSIDGSQPAATIQFDRAGQPTELAEFIFSRHTNRKFYSKRSLTKEQSQCLESETVGDAHLQLISDRRTMAQLGKLVAASDLIRFRSRPFHEELVDQLRFTVVEAESSRDGLDLRTLELPPGAGLLLRALRHWSMMQWWHRLGLGPLLSFPSGVAVKASGAIGVLSTPTPSTEGFLDSGRSLQRIWLRATQMGLGMHPLGSLPIYAAADKQGLTSNWADSDQRRLAKILQRLHQLIPSTGTTHLTMLFRLGNASPPRHRSLRRETPQLENSLAI